MAAVTTGVSLDTASVVFEPPRKKQCTGIDFSQLSAELDATSRAMEQSVADLKARIELMNDHQEQLVASEQVTHVPVPQIQDPVEHDEPLAIGDMVTWSQTRRVASLANARLFALDIPFSTGCTESCIHGNDVNRAALEWIHRERLVKLTNKL